MNRISRNLNRSLKLNKKRLEPEKAKPEAELEAHISDDGNDNDNKVDKDTDYSLRAGAKNEKNESSSGEQLNKIVIRIPPHALWQLMRKIQVLNLYKN